MIVGTKNEAKNANMMMANDTLFDERTVPKIKCVYELSVRVCECIMFISLSLTLESNAVLF